MMMNKKSLRQEIFARREALSPDYHSQANQQIIAKILESQLFKDSQTIFVYHGMGRELDTQSLIANALAQNKTIALPRVHRKGVMKAHHYQIGHQLEVSSFGIPEPMLDSPIIDPKDIDLVILPCVTTNDRGERLGYGGGFYDRFLPQTDAKVMLPYFEKLLTNIIPLEPHDQYPDIVLTENNIHIIKED